MTDVAQPTGVAGRIPSRPSAEAIQARLRRRYAAERRFRLLGLLAVLTGFGLLALLLLTVIAQAIPAFLQSKVQLEITFAEEVIAPEGQRDRQTLMGASYRTLVHNALDQRFPDVEGRQQERALHELLSPGAALELRDMVLEEPSIIGTTRDVWLTASDDVDQYVKGYVDPDLPERLRRLNNEQVAWLDTLQQEDRVERQFNTTLFTSGDSREPEMAGLWGAVVGSFWMMVVVLALSAPLGIAAALYLEEFAPKTRWVDVIEVNINNLAAVPSIVFGLLGLAVFLNLMGLPRSAPLVGGLTLTLMTLPTVVVATRAALRSIPPSIREAGYGIGASRVQVVSDHVLPLALPGILTGTIIGMAQALGESAPLLMIGMIAFIADVPDGPLSPATALPVQVYLWADSPERAFIERSAAAIVVLLGFLILMNALAVFLRQRFQIRW